MKTATVFIFTADFGEPFACVVPVPASAVSGLLPSAEARLVARAGRFARCLGIIECVVLRAVDEATCTQVCQFWVNCPLGTIQRCNFTISLTLCPFMHP